MEKRLDRLRTTVKLILQHVDSEDVDQHVRASIIRRGKDHGDTKTRVIARYSFHDFEDYLKHEDDIINTCEKQGARLYINPTVKSYKSIAVDMLVKIAQLLKGEDLSSIRRMYDSVADANTGIKDKRFWIIDVDFEDNPGLDVSSLYRDLTNYDALVFILQTKNGVHLIVKPHDISKLNTTIKYELKKNSPTLVYWPQNK